MAKIIKLEELTLKDVIETFVRYDIEHSRFPHNYIYEDADMPIIRGLVMDDEKLILLDQDQCDESMREAVIHELLHTKHFRLGDLRGRDIERVVYKETELTYKKLYGVGRRK